jgi:hypothetical protein
LLFIHLEELWLPIEWHLEIVNGFDAISLRFGEVKLKDPVLLDKDERSVLRLPWRQCFEVELHADLVEDRDIFDAESVNLLKLILRLSISGWPSLEDKELIWLLLFHDEVFATDAGDVSVILRLADRNDLVGLPCLSFEQRDWHFADSLVGFRVINEDFVDVGDQESVHRGQIQAHRAFKYLVRNWDLIVVNIAPPVYVKCLLIGLVGDAVLDARTEHHLVTTHEVKHDILERGLKRLLVDQVKVDVIVRGNLDSNIALDVKDEASDVKHVIFSPFLVVRIILFGHDLEEQDRARATSDQCLVVEQVHLAEIFVRHLLNFEVSRVVRFDCEGLSLSVEAIKYIVLRIIKTFVWEVHPIAIHLMLVEAALVDCMRAVVVGEVVVDLVVVVK